MCDELRNEASKCYLRMKFLGQGDDQLVYIKSLRFINSEK